MKLDNLKWTQTCCEWNGDYSEAPTVGGGVVRLKRNPDGIMVMRFDAQNRRVDDSYVAMTYDEVDALLA